MPLIHYINSEELCTALSISNDELSRFRRAGLPHYKRKNNGKCWYKLDDVEEWYINYIEGNYSAGMSSSYYINRITDLTMHNAMYSVDTKYFYAHVTKLMQQLETEGQHLLKDNRIKMLYLALNRIKTDGQSARDIILMMNPYAVNATELMIAQMYLKIIVAQVNNSLKIYD